MLNAAAPFVVPPAVTRNVLPIELVAFKYVPADWVRKRVVVLGKADRGLVDGVKLAV